jgi:hypothetical protein
VAAADDQVLEPSRKDQVALVVEAAEVAGHEPPVAIERVLCGPLVGEVTEHETGAPPADLAHLTVGNSRSRLSRSKMRIS